MIIDDHADEKFWLGRESTLAIYYALAYSHIAQSLIYGEEHLKHE